MSAESQQGPEFSDPEFQHPQSQSPQFQSAEFPGQQFQSPDLSDLRRDAVPQPGPQPQPQLEQDRDRSRQPDAVSIGSGLVFFLIGGVYLLASGGHLTVNAGWTLSMLALGLGLSGIVGAVLRVRRGSGRD